MQRREKGNDQKTQDNGINPVLLSGTELQWLLGKTKVSKIFEYQIRSRIKRKVKTLMELELPLLVKYNFIDNGLGRDLETGAYSMRTQALVRQRSRVQIPAKASFFLEKEPEMGSDGSSQSLIEMVRSLPNDNTRESKIEKLSEQMIDMYLNSPDIRNPILQIDILGLW